ncbi:hypothetical protein V6B95_09575 [Thermoanaerobacterium saccharolyticum]|uniref:hypothetical protein n=1 Tax=Thermoanaerobacterium saccharolyticum TaxID=28896 RepID=UPI0005EDEBC0
MKRFLVSLLLCLTLVFSTTVGFADQNVMQKDNSAVNVKEDNLKETDKINMIERIKANEIFPSEGILQKLSTESTSFK